MTLVRQHLFIIVVLTAFAAAGLTDFLAGPWAQQYASGSMDSLGWLVGPLVRSSNGIGSVTTFLVLWPFCIAYVAVLLSLVLLMRQIAHARD